MMMSFTHWQGIICREKLTKFMLESFWRELGMYIKVGFDFEEKGVVEAVM